MELDTFMSFLQKYVLYMYVCMYVCMYVFVYLIYHVHLTMVIANSLSECICFIKCSLFQISEKVLFITTFWVHCGYKSQ